jgi:hypothetical protein
MSEKEEKEIKRYLKILSEDFQDKLNFVIDEVKAVEERLTVKIDSMAKDLRKEIQEVKGELIAHRDNTEVHVQKAKIKKRA